MRRTARPHPLCDAGAGHHSAGPGCDVFGERSLSASSLRSEGVSGTTRAAGASAGPGGFAGAATSAGKVPDRGNCRLGIAIVAATAARRSSVPRRRSRPGSRSGCEAGGSKEGIPATAATRSGAGTLRDGACGVAGAGSGDVGCAPGEGVETGRASALPVVARSASPVEAGIGATVEVRDGVGSDSAGVIGKRAGIPPRSSAGTSLRSVCGASDPRNGVAAEEAADEPASPEAGAAAEPPCGSADAGVGSLLLRSSSSKSRAGWD